MGEPDLWLIRHGETEWSRDRRHTGRTDIPLTADGERSARALEPRLAGVHFDLVLASPLGRATRTAQLAGLAAEPEPLAQEWNYGVYEGRTTAEIQNEQPDWSVWTSPIPGGESLADVAARADRVIARVRTEVGRGGGARAVLVAHAHFLRVLGARWVDDDPGLARHLALDTATVSVLSWDRGAPVILRWNS